MPLPQELTTALAAVAAAPRLLVATDFDGVLAPFVVDPMDYEQVSAAVAEGGFTLTQRRELAAKAFRHTADYDVAVASWMSQEVAPAADGSTFPEWSGFTWERSAVLRYGENPHQAARLESEGWGIAAAK